MAHGSLLTALLVSAATLGLSASAYAQSVIKRPGAHPDYVFEAEPHLAFGFLDGPYDGEGFGPGFRGTIELVDNGFVSTINNTVGIGFGLDWLMYGDHCHGNRRDCHSHDRIILPVVLQWNFWLTRQWSVFGEPGLALRFHNDHDGRDFDDRGRRTRLLPFVFYAGGRYHFTDSVALTMRIGHPTLSVGVSFLL